MQVQSNSLRIKRRPIFYFVITILALGMVTPALAAYLGPNRVVTGATSVCKVVLYECQYVPSKDEWRYKKVDDWSCSNEDKPWLGYPSDPSSQGCFAATAGDSFWSREETLQEATITYPPATINSSVQNCTLNNGWCNTAPVLSLSGNEPVTGYNILAIEGTLNGQTFACSGKNCSVPLNQGNNDLTFWALSSWGDTSEMGSATAKVDSTLPNITGTLSGTAGSNGWYLGPVSFIGSASDTTSGLASFTCTLNNIGLPSCNSLTVNTAGAHSLVLTARDNAGNTRLLTQNASVDLHNPSLTASLIGIMGSNNWYNSASLNGSASDPVPGSGLSVFQYNQDEGGWVSFPVSGELELSDGKHSIDIRAIDNAGRTVSSSKSFWLDSLAPELIINPSGTMGMNNWYTSGPLFTASASDNTSGMDIFEYSLDNGSWTPYSSPLVLSDGVHVLSFWAQDVSGLVTRVERTYQVDMRAPQISGSLSGVPGANGWYTSNVTLSAAASDPTPGSGLESFTYTLNSTSEKPYTDALILSDGIHTVQLDAQDKAGWTYSSGKSIKVDTLAPALRMQTTLPNWISNLVTVEGTASDPSAASSQPSSGLSKVEVSTDRGQTWQPTAGNGSWSYAWDTAQNLNGVHELHIRATDNAGLTTEQTIPVGVDNAAPKISLPASWYQWDTVTLDIWDNDSGLAEARVEISDPEGRWPTRKIHLDLDNFPMDFKWDRRFGDGTVAPLGTYDIEVIAFDSLSNRARQNADINILLGILPAGPASTPQPNIRDESNSLPITIAVPPSATTLPQSAFVSTFGSTPEAVVQASTTTENIQPVHATATQISVLDWLESILVPNPDAIERESIEDTADISNRASQSSASDTNILWGATAAAMIGAATAYALDEKRKREEEVERNRAEIQARIDEQFDRKIAAEEARKVAQWLEGQAILKSKELHQLEMADVTNEERLAAHKQSEQYQAYQTRMEDWREQQAKWKALENADMTEKEKLAPYKDSAEYKEREATLQQYHHEQRVQSAETARWEGLASQGQNAANMPEENWWEKTKTFVHDNLTEPFSTHVYDPYVKPVVEQTKDAFTAGVAWANTAIYTPYILPKVEEAKQELSDNSAWINEQIYQPYIQPAFEKAKQQISEDITWINAHIYQPYVQPMVEKTREQLAAGIDWFSTNVYQPHLQPFLATIQPYTQPLLEKAKDAVTEYQSWVNINIYQPIFQPVVDDVKDIWAEYGEWVHGAMDAAGFIPGLGEIADGLNGLIYLAEGNYIEASISALAMIPILGDLGKAGKLTAAIGQELLQEATQKVAKEATEEFVEVIAKETVEEVTERTAKETGEELLAVTVKETFEETAEKSSKETVEELAEQAAKGSADDLAQTGLKQAGEEFVQGTSKEVAEKTTKAATDKAVTNVADDAVEATPTTSIKNASQTVAGEVIEQSLERVSEETTQRALKEVVAGQVTKLPSDIAVGLTEDSARELAEKLSVQLGGKRVWVSAKSGSVYVSSPPAEGFALAELLAKTDLTNRAEVEKILKRVAELTSRGSGDHVILGPFRPNGVYIQEALDTNGVFWDVGDELWKALEKTGIDMFRANDQFLRVQIEKAVDSFDIIGTNVDEVIRNVNDSPPIDWKDIKYTEKEIWDLATMPDFPYQLVGNSWIRVDLVNSMK